MTKKATGNVLLLGLFVCGLYVFGHEKLRSDMDFIIALGTLILAAATIWLAARTGDIIISAEKSSERQLRAYVLVDTLKIMDLAVGKMPSAIITIKNFGQTPAKKIIHTTRLGFSTYPEWVAPQEDVPEYLSESMLGPQATGTAQTPTGLIISQNEINALNNKTHAIYVLGKIQYKDIFGISRSTKYKYYCNNVAALEVSVCSDGNEYD